MILIQMKDDCTPFDPQERAQLATGANPVQNIGIRMVYALAEEVTYQNLLGAPAKQACFSMNHMREARPKIWSPSVIGSL